MQGTLTAEDLRFTARSLLGRDPDIWHIHNHSLGKNGFDLNPKNGLFWRERHAMLWSIVWSQITENIWKKFKDNMHEMEYTIS